MKKITKEEFTQRLKDKGRNDIEIIGDYKNASTKVLVKCTNKDCLWEWEVSPQKLLQGKGCPKCAINKRKEYKRKSEEQFLDELKEKTNDKIISLESYINNRTKIKFQCKECGYIWDCIPSNLLRGHGCPKCNRKIANQKQMKNQEVFECQFKEKGNPNVIQLEPYKGARTSIKWGCKNNPKHIWYSTPGNMLKGKNCPYCTKQKLLEEDKESIGDVRPDLIKYFVNKEDAFKYRPCSNKKVLVKCPICNRVKDKKQIVSGLYNRGFFCNFCNDNITNPNKFIREIGYQLYNLKEVECFNLEYSPSWAGLYRYDCYFKKNDLDILVELDGVQHKESVAYFKTKNNDVKKNELAKTNGYILIRIDCEKTKFDFMKEQILKSDLLKYISLDKIDWRKVELALQKSMLKEVCDMYENDKNKDISLISKEMKLSEKVVKNYLERGNKLGLCNYEKVVVNFNAKPISIQDLHSNKIYNFPSKEQAKKWLENTGITISMQTITKCLEGKKESFKGYKFKYVPKFT